MERQNLPTVKKLIPIIEYFSIREVIASVLQELVMHELGLEKVMAGGENTLVIRQELYENIVFCSVDIVFFSKIF